MFKESKILKVSKITKVLKVLKKTRNKNNDVEITLGTYTTKQREIINRILEAFNKAKYYKVLGIISNNSPE